MNAGKGLERKVTRRDPSASTPELYYWRSHTSMAVRTAGTLGSKMPYDVETLSPTQNLAAKPVPLQAGEKTRPFRIDSSKVTVALLCCWYLRAYVGVSTDVIS